jgi:hypothetical protein
MATTDGCSGCATGGVSLRWTARAAARGLRAVAVRLGLHDDEVKCFCEDGVRGDAAAADGADGRLREWRGDAGEEEDPKRDDTCGRREGDEAGGRGGFPHIFTSNWKSSSDRSRQSLRLSRRGGGTVGGTSSGCSAMTSEARGCECLVRGGNMKIEQPVCYESGQTFPFFKHDAAMLWRRQAAPTTIRCKQ